MIYATEQQVVVTAVSIIVVALVALFTGVIWGRRRGLEEAAEEQRWAREQAKTRRIHPVYGEPPEVAHGTWMSHEDQALTLANELPEDELLHEWHDHPPLKYGDEAVSGCPNCEARWETAVLEPTAVISREEMSWTGEIQRMTDAFAADMERLIGGTDERLRGITR